MPWSLILARRLRLSGGSWPPRLRRPARPFDGDGYACAAQTGCGTDEGAGAPRHGPVGSWPVRRCAAVTARGRQDRLNARAALFVLAVPQPQGRAAETRTRVRSRRLMLLDQFGNVVAAVLGGHALLRAKPRFMLPSFAILERERRAVLD